MALLMWNINLKKKNMKIITKKKKLNLKLKSLMYQTQIL